jgi:hypothetical protein
MDSTPRTSARGRAAAALAAVLALALVVGGSSHAQAPPQQRDLLPDLQVALPDHVVVAGVKNRLILGFNSALLNRGEGPLEIEGSRQSTKQPGMHARQLVTRSDGSKSIARDVGSLRYVTEPGHRYWHLDDVLRYELRSFDTFALVAQGSRRGYCLRDGATFAHHCGRSQPRLLSLTIGVGPARLSRWAPVSEGQSFEVTRVPSGRYWLVIRADPRGRFIESNAGNDASSVLLDFANTAEGRRRSVRVTTLGGCPGAERCEHPESFAR